MDSYSFFLRHWGDLLIYIGIFFALTIRFLPPEIAGLDKEYWNSSLGKTVPQKKQSLLEAVTTAVFFTSIRSVLTVLTLKGTTSLMMFAVIGVELYYRKTISNNAVIISVVGILALYADHLVTSAEEFSIGGKLFYYKKNK